MKLSRVSLLSAAALVAQAVLGQPAFQVHAAEVAAAEMESQMKAGETTFKAACMACHSATTCSRSVSSEPTEIRTIQRPSRIAGVR